MLLDLTNRNVINGVYVEIKDKLWHCLTGMYVHTEFTCSFHEDMVYTLVYDGVQFY